MLGFPTPKAGISLEIGDGKRFQCEKTATTTSNLESVSLPQWSGVYEAALQTRLPPLLHRYI